MISLMSLPTISSSKIARKSNLTDIILHPNVFLAARNPLGGGSSSHGLVEGDLLVVGGGFSSLVKGRTTRAVVLVAVNAVRLGFLFLAKITLDHSIEITGSTLK